MNNEIMPRQDSFVEKSENKKSWKEIYKEAWQTSLVTWQTSLVNSAKRIAKKRYQKRIRHEHLVNKIMNNKRLIFNAFNNPYNPYNDKEINVKDFDPENKIRKELESYDSLSLQTYWEKDKLDYEALIKGYEEKLQIIQCGLLYEVDFSYWSKMPQWNLHQALVLSLSYDPIGIREGDLYCYERANLLADNFGVVFQDLEEDSDQKIYDLFVSYFERESIAKAHHIETISPVDFIAWFDSMKFSIPEELRKSVSDQHNIILDWQGAYGALYKKFEKQQSVVAELEYSLSQVSNENEQHLANKSLTSLLKILLAVAVKHYRYDPTDKKSSTTTNIIDTVSEIGLEISDKTVKSWLSKAAEKLEGQYELPQKR